MIVAPSASSERSSASRSASTVSRRARSASPYSAAAPGEVEPVRGGDVLLEASRSPADREEMEDPAAVVVEQHDRQRQRQPPRGEQAADVVGQRDVADQQHHRALAGRGGAERASTRCRRSRWRRGWRARAGRRSRAAKNFSTSRTGIEEATNSVASAGSRLAQRARDRRLGQLVAERRVDRRGRGVVGGAPGASQPGSTSSALGAAGSAARAAASRRPPPGSCQSP